ncbi:MAG: hypothetical protein ACUVXI_09310 [bacterium]
MAEENRSLKELYLRAFDSAVPAILASQREDGSFWGDEGTYSVYSQNAGFVLALLYSTPGSRYCGDEELLRAAVRSGNFNLRSINDDGTFPIVTPGGEWGHSSDEWRVYFWMELFHLIQGKLDDSKRALWRDGILRGVEACYRTAERGFNSIDYKMGVGFSSPNHMAWFFLCLYRAGSLFDRNRYVELAEEGFRKVIEGQTVDGLWYESGGPTPMYNLVTALALANYYTFSRNPRCLAPLKRALDFHIRYLYPDLSIIETSEGRQRYHPRVGYFPLQFSHWPEGRGLLRRAAERIVEEGVDYLRFQTLSFVASTLPGLEEGEEEELRFPEIFLVESERIGVRRRGSWVVSFSGFPGQDWPGRWRLDHQNCLSVFHRDVGLVIGGGNSKDMPEFSSFSVQEGGKLIYKPTYSSLSFSPEGDSIHLRYGDTLCGITSSFPDGDRIRLTFALMKGEPDRVEAGFTIYLPPGGEIAVRGAEALLRDGSSRLSLPGEGKIQGDEFTISSSPGATIIYPLLPFNPYDRKGIAPREHAVVGVRWELSKDRPEATATVEISKRSGRRHTRNLLSNLRNRKIPHSKARTPYLLTDVTRSGTSVGVRFPRRPRVRRRSACWRDRRSGDNLPPPSTTPSRSVWSQKMRRCSDPPDSPPISPRGEGRFPSRRS